MEFLLCNEYACLLFEKGDNFCDILFAFLHTKIMIKSSAITNQLSIKMAGLIIDYLSSSD